MDIYILKKSLYCPMTAIPITTPIPTPTPPTQDHHRSSIVVRGFWRPHRSCSDFVLSPPHQPTRCRDAGTIRPNNEPTDRSPLLLLSFGLWSWSGGVAVTIHPPTPIPSLGEIPSAFGRHNAQSPNIQYPIIQTQKNDIRTVHILAPSGDVTMYDVHTLLPTYLPSNLLVLSANTPSIPSIPYIHTYIHTYIPTYLPYPRLPVSPSPVSPSSVQRSHSGVMSCNKSRPAPRSIRYDMIQKSDTMTD